MENFLGINVADTYTSADRLPLPLGTVARQNEKLYHLVLADEDITDKDVVAIDQGTHKVLQIDGGDTLFAEQLVGVAVCDIDDTEYGWVQVYGRATANVAAGCVQDVHLYTCATAGHFDDSAADQYLIMGVVALEDEDGGEAEVFLNRPYVSAGAYAAPDFTATGTSALYTLGAVKWDDDKAYMYVQADGAITASAWVGITAAGQAGALEKGENDTVGNRVGVAEVGFDDDDYGWVLVSGMVDAAEVLDACNAAATLYAQDDAGIVDDGSDGNEIAGAVTLEDEGGGGGGDVKALLTFPRITE
jgi:hypothetical protein